jgi:hypothetical protein
MNEQEYLLRIAPTFNVGDRIGQLMVWADSAEGCGHPALGGALRGLAYLASGGGTCLPSIRRFVNGATPEELAPWIIWLAEVIERPEDVPEKMSTCRSVNPKLIVALP